MTKVNSEKIISKQGFIFTCCCLLPLYHLNNRNKMLFFDLYMYFVVSFHSDLKPLFNWNVKQLFLYLTAEYKTENNVSFLTSCQSAAALFIIAYPFFIPLDFTMFYIHR